MYMNGSSQYSLRRRQFKEDRSGLTFNVVIARKRSGEVQVTVAVIGPLSRPPASPRTVKRAFLTATDVNRSPPEISSSHPVGEHRFRSWMMPVPRHQPRCAAATLGEQHGDHDSPNAIFRVEIVRFMNSPRQLGAGEFSSLGDFSLLRRWRPVLAVVRRMVSVGSGLLLQSNCTASDERRDSGASSSPQHVMLWPLFGPLPPRLAIRKRRGGSTGFHAS